MLGARIFFFFLVLYFWVLLCGAIKLVGISLILLRLVLSILRQVQSSLQSVSNLASLLRQYPSVFSSRLPYHEVFLLWLVGVATPPSSVWALGTIPPSFGGLFSGLHSFLACCSVLKEAREPSPDFWADLPCPSPRCALICWFWLLWFPTVSFTQGDCQAPFGSLLSQPCWKSLYTRDRSELGCLWTLPCYLLSKITVLQSEVWKRFHLFCLLLLLLLQVEQVGKSRSCYCHD